MGKINDMKDNQDFNIVSFKKYVKNKENAKKPVLKINDIKDVATLLGPNAKNYRLSRNLKDLQQKGRKAIAFAGLVTLYQLVIYLLHIHMLLM